MKIIKRIALAFVCGFVFVLGYVFLVTLIYAFITDHPSIGEIIGLPVSFGYYIYKYFGGKDSPEFVEENTVLFFSMMFSFPIVLYSLLAYLLLTLISKYRPRKKEFAAPPLPPEKFE